MENNKKAKLIKSFTELVVTLFFIFSVAFGIFMYLNNEQLKEQILKRDKLIESSKQRDSAFNEVNDSTASVITKYTSDCRLIINGKEVSLESLVNSISTLQNDKLALLKEQLRLQKELNKSMINQIDLNNESTNQKNVIIKTIDSSHLYKYLYEYIQRFYGTDVYIVSEGNKNRIKQNFSRADSAYILFGAFKDKLKKDSVTGSYYIIKESYKR